MKKSPLVSDYIGFSGYDPDYPDDIPEDIYEEGFKSYEAFLEKDVVKYIFNALDVTTNDMSVSYIDSEDIDFDTVEVRFGVGIKNDPMLYDSVLEVLQNYKPEPKTYYGDWGERLDVDDYIENETKYTISMCEPPKINEEYSSREPVDDDAAAIEFSIIICAENSDTKYDNRYYM